MTDTEINEDNCVLDYNDMQAIDSAFMNMYTYSPDGFPVIDEEVKPHWDGLFLKINKLNDMAKERQNERG